MLGALNLSCCQVFIRIRPRFVHNSSINLYVSSFLIKIFSFLKFSFFVELKERLRPLCEGCSSSSGCYKRRRDNLLILDFDRMSFMIYLKSKTRSMSTFDPCSEEWLNEPQIDILVNCLSEKCEYVYIELKTTYYISAISRQKRC